MSFFDDLEQQYRDWLKDNKDKGSSEESRSSYVSGMKSLISWIDKHKNLWVLPKDFKLYDFQDYLKNIKCSGDVKTLFSAALNIIQKEIDNDKSIFKKSTLQNYKSYLVAFEEFMLEMSPFDPNAKGLYQNHRKVLRDNGFSATYTHKELIAEFSNRITSQDRISKSKDILFPISLIKIIWPDDTKEWANKVCENIYLIVEDEKNVIREVQIKNIDLLSINRTGEVMVFVNKNDKTKAFVLLTSYSDPYESCSVSIEDNKGIINFIRKRTSTSLTCKFDLEHGFLIDKNQNIRNPQNPKSILLWHVKKLKIKSLGGLAIDHDIPISIELVEKRKKLKKLEEISELYRVLSEKYGLAVTADKVREFPRHLTEDDKDGFRKIKFPKNDLYMIGRCKLVLMGKVENSIKSDN